MIIFMIFFVVIIIYVLLSCIRPPNFPPGPVWLPIVGNSLLLKKLGKKHGGQYGALLQLSKEYNTDVLGFKLGGSKYVAVFGRKKNYEVFIRDEFQGRPDGFFIRLRTNGTRKGITMTDGPLWQQHRAFVDKTLKLHGFRKEILGDLIRKELSNLFSKFSEKSDNISLRPLFGITFLNILWTVIGGKESVKDHETVTELMNLMKERDKAFDIAGGLLNQMPWLRYMAPNYSGYNLVKSLNSKLSSFVQDIVNDHKNSLTSENRDFIDAYLHEQASGNKDSATFTDEQLVATCLDFFIAGSLTTSGTLDFAILTVLKNPEVKQKIREVLDNVVEKGRSPSLEDKKKLQYIEAVLIESQRLQHIVPTAGPRRVLRDTMLDNYYIPKDTVVLLSLRSIHHDEERWRDPKVFRPERFLDDQGNLCPDEGLAFFGLGKRRCPGEKLAKNFLFLAFTTFFYYYDVKLTSSVQETQRPAGILLSPPPYTVSIQRRL